MAEVLGVVVGVAAFALQVDGTIRKLRQVRTHNKNKAGDDLEALVRRLEMLRHILLFLEKGQTSDMAAYVIKNCQLAYSSVDNTLERVGKKLASLAGSKLRAVCYSKGIKEELRDVEQKLDGVIGDLTCSITVDRRFATARVSEEISQQVQLPVGSAGNDAMIINTRIENSPPASGVTPAEPSLLQTTPADYPTTLLRPRRALNCAVRRCFCSCHTTRRSSTRFWAFEYSLPSIFSRNCSNPKCTASCYRWSLQLALSRYGIPFKVNAAVEFITGAGGYSLRPALDVDRVVNYTSPGFEILWRFSRGLLTLSDVQEGFRRLKTSDPSLNWHINPGGRNYVQELLHYGPWTCRAADQFELLIFLACELGVTLEGLDQRFLVECAEWIGEGPHLNLLEVILALGFDPSMTESPVYEDWPEPCSPNWISEELTPDPFFIEYLALLAKACSGFAGLTPLHESVLLSTPSSVKSFLSRSALHMERNFLGQTPLHLAVHNVEIVRLLVQSGHDMDIPDNHGITPLMYAAGINKADVVFFLIDQGANPLIRDTRWNRDFIGYADARGNWRLIMDTLDAIQATYPPKHFHHLVYSALMRLIARETWRDDAWSTYFAELVGLCPDTNIRFGCRMDSTEDNNLLHFVSNPDDVKVLMRHGFKLLNAPNSAGRTAIFSLARILNSTLTQSLLDYGTNLNHVDYEGHSLLFLLTREMSQRHSIVFDIMDSIAICLKSGIDIFSSDGCRCSCAPNGCFLPASFNITFADCIWTDGPEFVWALEILSLVEEVRGHEDAKRLLLGFVRRTCSDRVGITHVCCHRGKSRYKDSFVGNEGLMDESDIDEILEEEEELIATLEEELLPFTSDSFERLRSKWMSMLKEKYQEQTEAVEKRKEQRGYSTKPLDRTYHVDYKTDSFHEGLVVNMDPFIPSIAGCMAEYVIWLEHQYFRSQDTWNAPCEREAWYRRRMRWFEELMQVMDVSIKMITEKINRKIGDTSWQDKDRPDGERVVSHFVSSLQGL